MKKYERLLFGLLIVIGIGSLYISNQVYTIYGGDAGDLVSAIITRGIPHPPGYPLYTSFGILADNLLKNWGTAAWRTGFVSSIPSIIFLILLFDLLYLLNRKILHSFIGVVILALTYPIFLYSVVTEVFALNNLFTVLLLWTFFCFSAKGNLKYFYLGSFVFGLSLTHHHIILFLLPPLLYLISLKKRLLKMHVLIKSSILILAGLIPYSYVFISGMSNTPINWMGMPTLTNFINLVTRATYGTFKVGAFVAHNPYLRLLDIWSFFDFAYKDFRITGVILFLAGFIFLLKTNKRLFITLALGLASYLFFIFYASFPLVENFLVGTFERFIQPLYIFIAIYVTFGMISITYLIEVLLKKFLNKDKIYLVLYLSVFLFLIYPVGLLKINYPRVSILKNDFTAENFARDILDNVPADSIILMSVDTPLFDTQYIYYSERKWPSIKLIHFSKLFYLDFAYQFKSLYPDVILTDSSLSVNDQFKKFMNDNYPLFPIMSKQAFATPDGDWLPWGMYHRYYKKSDIPKDIYIYEENEKIWKNLHDPLSGSLSKYQNLLLSDVLRMYSDGHQEYAFWAARHGYNETAEKHLLISEKLNPGDLDSYTILAQVYIQEKRCEDAQLQLDFRLLKDPGNAETYMLSSINYAVCFKNEKKASYYQDLYEEKSRKKEIELQKL